MIYIKKIVLVFTLCLFLFGCTYSEVSVNNHGDSETYLFLKKNNFNKEKYTLKLKNDNSDIIIIHNKDKTYYGVIDDNENIVIIEKDHIRYTLNINNKSYMKENISDYTDYAMGILPNSLNILKTQKYKKSKKRIGIFNYLSEKYVYSGGITTYYLRNKKIKYIKNETPLNEVTAEFISISSKVDNNKFDIPKGYKEMEL